MINVRITDIYIHLELNIIKMKKTNKTDGRSYTYSNKMNACITRNNM